MDTYNDILEKKAADELNLARMYQAQLDSSKPIKPLPDLSKLDTFNRPIQNQTIVNVSENGVAAVNASENGMATVVGGDVSNPAISNSGAVNYDASSISKIRLRIDSEGGADSQKLNEIADLLEKILSGQVAPKKGMLSKFSDLMERNSWISSAFAGALLGWLKSSFDP